MNTCPYCQVPERLVKAGWNRSGSQRWKCQQCQRRYTPEWGEKGYPEPLRLQAVRMYVGGMNYRWIGRHLGVDHKSVMHCGKAYTDQLPDDVSNEEMDELYTFLGQKNRVYIMTLVDGTTSCTLGWEVAPERGQARLQIVDEAPTAAFYFSDLFSIYRMLIFTPGHYTPVPDKRETYRVEGDNAELRHYLVRLARRSRCFSRCIHALRVP